LWRMHPTTSAVRSALSPLLCALFATSASAKVLVPKISVCQGSICIKHGGPLVLEAAESVACTNAEIAVVPARCMSACKGKKDAKFVATFISATKKQAVLDGAYLDGDAALTAACNTIESELGVAPDALLRQAVQSKLDGDKAIESGDAKTAVESYSAAIDAVPLSFLDALVAEAAAGQEKPPPKHTGLPPSRMKQAIIKERERVTPGPQRWIFEAMVGRCRARLTLGDQADAALADARDATALCPLAPSGWEALMQVGEASGDAELAASAGEEMQRRMPR